MIHEHTANEKAGENEKQIHAAPRKVKGDVQVFRPRSAGWEPELNVMMKQDEADREAA
jgi:hypothetical protein